MSRTKKVLLSEVVACVIAARAANRQLVRLQQAGATPRRIHRERVTRNGQMLRARTARANVEFARE